VSAFAQLFVLSVMTELVFVDGNIHVFIHIVADVDATSPRGFHEGGGD